MYCSKCGSTIAETVTFCPVCGQSQAAGYASGQPPLLQPTGPAEVTPHWQPMPVVAYAGFWLRVVASILDGLIIGLPVMIVVMIVVLSSGFGSFIRHLPDPPPDPSEALGQAIGAAFFVGIGIVFLLFFLGSWLYFALFESSSWQATPGKKVLNIFVTDMNGAPVSFGRATGRYFAKFITELIPLKVGYMLAGLTERKQALHDMIASTLVLRR